VVIDNICPTYSPITTVFQVGVEEKIYYKVQKEFNGVCVQYEPVRFVPRAKTPDDISFRVDTEDDALYIAPLLCSARGP